MMKSYSIVTCQLQAPLLIPAQPANAYDKSEILKLVGVIWHLHKILCVVVNTNMINHVNSNI